MRELRCPFCGERPIHEFQFRTVVSADMLLAVDRLYLRDNFVTHSREYWQHLHGCRAWLLVHRDPSNDDVVSIDLLGGSRQ